MRGALRILPLLLALVIPASAVRAAEPEFPPLTGRVVDEAGLLSERDQAELEAALARFEAETTSQIVVATLESLQGLPIEDYGYQLGRHWGIGQEGKDNGALLIVAPEERAVRIEVGYGLEGELTDALSRTIIETRILPHFRAADFAAGIKAGVAAMIEALGGSYDPALPPVQVRDREDAPSPIPLAIALPIMALIVLNRLSGGRRRRRSRYGYGGPVIVPGGWHGGRNGGGGSRGGGGGGFSGGGGGFGGGGASGRW
ncbi:MAG TPA: TPM domain-containing protein [Geminicoccaceae bacterium]|nr:TPM domain-containing protein [Geminicoccaceae bacterium]